VWHRKQYKQSTQQHNNSLPFSSLMLGRYGRRRLLYYTYHGRVRMSSSSSSSIPSTCLHSSLVNTYQQASDLHNDNDKSSLSPWLVIVDSYVLDLAQFIDHHPGNAQKIRDKRRELGPDITNNFLDHFAYTIQTFRKACRDFDVQQQPVTFRFTVGTHRNTAAANVVIVGKIKS
jgi:cytochrome b involved in lipid metabolism